MVPFAAPNAGVLVAWSAPLLERFEGVPIKNAALTAGGRTVRGEPTITATGLEGGPIYALGPELRSGHGLEIDLQPDLDADALAARLVDRRRPKDSVSTWLRKGGLSPVDVALLRDATGNRLPTEATAIAGLAKAVPIPVDGLAPIDAPSRPPAASPLMPSTTPACLDRPGTWVAGEMVAWDAPTGGYLIQACLSTGHRAGVAAARWAAEHPD